MEENTKKARGFDPDKDSYDRITAVFGFIALLVLLVYLIYINSIAIITPFNPKGMQNYVQHFSVEEVESNNPLAISFVRPEKFVVNLMTESPKIVVVFLWFLFLVYLVSFIFGVPYLIVMFTEWKFWPIGKFREAMFGKE